MVENDKSPNTSEIGNHVHKHTDIIHPLLALSGGLSLYDATKVDFSNIKMIENQ